MYFAAKHLSNLLYSVICSSHYMLDNVSDKKFAICPVLETHIV